MYDLTELFVYKFVFIAELLVAMHLFFFSQKKKESLSAENRDWCGNMPRFRGCLSHCFLFCVVFFRNVFRTVYAVRAIVCVYLLRNSKTDFLFVGRRVYCPAFRTRNLRAACKFV